MSKQTKDNTVRKKRQSTSAIKKQKKIQRKIQIQRQRKLRLIKESILAVALLLVLLYIQSFFFFTLSKVNSYAMSPTLKMGEYVLVEKKRRIQRHDIVLIKRENAQAVEIKRVIGLPNENVEYKEDKLIINGVKRSEPYLSAEKIEAANNIFLYTNNFILFELTGNTKLPEDRYFVLGDNRLYSTDSRDYGLINRTEIIGVITMK
ncbi:signal peptidase I [Enterococcus crotali]|uniref:signal peptidase I n=1 Tax=Enterococcus crotali TaxID=1453587 RepID=UPI0004716398|nr:signal peptidase I [Enterococcus crotali]